MHPQALTTAVIEPIITWAAAQRGRKTALVAECQKAAPEMPRQLVESWLCPNPDRRSQPNLGNGLLLMTAAQTLGVYTLGEILATLQPQPTNPTT